MTHVCVYSFCSHHLGAMVQICSLRNTHHSLSDFFCARAAFALRSRVPMPSLFLLSHTHKATLSPPLKPLEIAALLIHLAGDLQICHRINKIYTHSRRTGSFHPILAVAACVELQRKNVAQGFSLMCMMMIWGKEVHRGGQPVFEFQRPRVVSLDHCILISFLLCTVCQRYDKDCQKNRTKWRKKCELRRHDV
jgi:hypothetical protein